MKSESALTASAYWPPLKRAIAASKRAATGVVTTSSVEGDTDAALVPVAAGVGLTGWAKGGTGAGTAGAIGSSGVCATAKQLNKIGNMMRYPNLDIYHPELIEGA